MILPLTVMGPVIICAAALLMCLASLTVLSSAFKVSDRHYAESRLLNTLFLLRELQDDSHAGLAGVPGLLRPGVQFIRFDATTLAPMAFTQFCLHYVGECRSQRLLFRGGRPRLTSRRWAELVSVNRSVNASILPERNNEGLAGEKWLLGPAFGDCNDYAVTKRHQLIARGWPARAVLLSEVVTYSGEHHLVTVVRAKGGDLVLDNLTDSIIPWFQKPYQWLRIQTPGNPNYWASIAGPDSRRPGDQIRPPQRIAVSLQSGA